MNQTEACQRIEQIDQHIDVLRLDAEKFAGFHPRAASGWQKIWDARPDLYAAQSALFRERGEAQAVRDALEAPKAAHRAFMKQRALRKQCPTCGYHTITA